MTCTHTTTKRELVVCLIFNPNRTHVLLIRKIQPTGRYAWMNGRLHGPGGKCEPGESPLDAAYRELGEEVGARTGLEPVAVLEFSDARIHFFRGEMYFCDTYQAETEPVFWLPLELALSDPALMDNLRDLIPYALGQETELPTLTGAL